MAVESGPHSAFQHQRGRGRSKGRDAVMPFNMEQAQVELLAVVRGRVVRGKGVQFEPEVDSGLHHQ